uniref:AAA_lid_10 domain-containing protein n=1 Tax=Thelazia callipaeda TaxID=103827 RepID=A0A0N5D7Y8_THECL
LLLSPFFSVDSIYINCVSENTERDILTVITNKFRNSKKKLHTTITFSDVKKEAAKLNKNIIIVLDEIDYLRPCDRNFLCSVFDWPVFCTRISVIGIANALNMDELQRHQLKHSPKQIIFAPYSKDQLQFILSKKLATNINNTNAIELCARKVAAMTGDARKAMQIARWSVSIGNSDNVSCRDVLGTINSIYSSPLHQVKMPLQQKILLATMLRIVGDKASTVVNKGYLLSAYGKVCERLLLPALEVDEIHGALSLLEAQSILESKPSSYQLLVDKASSNKIIADSTLISQINMIELEDT